MSKESVNAKRIRKGDRVIVLAGNDRGKIGEVLSRKNSDRLVVQGINIKKKHVKRSQLDPEGGIRELEFPIHASNLQLVNESDHPIKVKVRFNSDGEKELYYVQDGNEVLYRRVMAAK
jgi:large subunit ribosomal protein L24